MSAVTGCPPVSATRNRWVPASFASAPATRGRPRQSALAFAELLGGSAARVLHPTRTRSGRRQKWRECIRVWALPVEVHCTGTVASQGESMHLVAAMQGECTPATQRQCTAAAEPLRRCRTALGNDRHHQHNNKTSTAAGLVYWLGQMHSAALLKIGHVSAPSCGRDNSRVCVSAWLGVAPCAARRPPAQDTVSCHSCKHAGAGRLQMRLGRGKAPLVGSPIPSHLPAGQWSAASSQPHPPGPCE